ncbi:MAG: class I SAM-dependent methyltransferase [Halobacteriaceae archaeon]
MVTWDERFRAGDYPTDPDPPAVLRSFVDALPAGRALDVATGPGRNALFLARHGYEVDAIDASRPGLELARENATERGVDVNLIQADAETFPYPESTYAVVTVTYFRTLDRITDLVAALRPGGVLVYQHHLRTSDPVDVGPRDDRHRFGSNELLRAALGLTVLHYEERRTTRDGRSRAVATLVARASRGAAQSYPARD